MSERLSNDDLPRISTEVTREPCPHCGVLVKEGALKCRGCHRWLGKPRRRSVLKRSLSIVAATMVATIGVFVGARKSPVGEAPPLTPMTTAEAAAQAAAAPVADIDPPEGQLLDVVEPEKHDRTEWTSRHIMTDVHPLDAAFSADGTQIFVSGDDATLRAFDVATGRVLHLKRMPAQGDRIRLLHDRYVAMIREVEAAHIPIADTHNWDQEPAMLWVGRHPADVIAMPDGKTVVTASSMGQRLSWYDLETKRRLANIKLPHATQRLYLLALPDERPYVAAMGLLHRAGRPAGAWLDLFDPSETPFGATRRSIAVGRDPGPGAVSADGSRLFFADPLSNTASLVRVDEITNTQTMPVGHGPIASFLLHGDRYGVTLDGENRTATVIDLESQSTQTLMLEGVPRAGATSPDGSTLYVSLGGSAWPPKGSGAVVIGGVPPQIIATLKTDRGASRVVASPRGRRAAVANYHGKTLTIIEPKPMPPKADQPPP
ncbi:MAG: hypothetical protein R3B72_30270 [Polyangiaceae bacterium]